MAQSEAPRRPLTPKDVARRFAVHPVTVRRWADTGLLRFFTTPAGHRRFTAEEVERFERERFANDAPEPAAS